MRKQLDKSNDLEKSLQQLDQNINWNQERKQRLQTELFTSLELEDTTPPKRRGIRRFILAPSIVAVLFVAFIGYNAFSPDLDRHDQSLMGVEEDGLQQESVAGHHHGQEATEQETFATFSEDKDLARANPAAEAHVDVELEMDLRLPQSMPNEHHEPATMHTFEDPDGVVTSTVDYILDNDRYIGFKQTEMTGTKEEMIAQLKRQMSPDQVIKELSVLDHPAILFSDGEPLAYHSLYIITDPYLFTVTAQGLSEEEILEMARFIDLSGL
ncbi:hypothetical protein [Desertibacillus haloalkaliphilus]|uniref:hypothetical protein n=1 Tax=Desertibacillus haloalkaliphilus TaxID=1328930 RepID=UPI001C278EC1|nr:hypothetical protein [Desertibacillus haloalkaliphilus]MBU8905321.1 hypothetical protein [Desertibacillus haloalkaliphilus]